MKPLHYIMMLVPALALCVASCSTDDDPDASISVIKDTQTPQNALDKWLYKNYVEPYNIELRYRWEDNEISMDYILVPAEMDHSIQMARMIKYICFEAFDKVTGSTKFIHDYFPKQIQLVGNPGWNSDGSQTLGSSEGGYKINLWYVNHLGDVIRDANYQVVDSVITNREELNKTYFHTIIHEFGHTFHQKVAYSNEFNKVTGKKYLGGMWTSEFKSETDPQIYALGFVTAYAAYSANEDFAEVFSTYVCNTKDEFQSKLDKAGNDGKSKILLKLRIVREYFKENWHLDIDALRDEVQRREANLKNVDFSDITIR